MLTSSIIDVERNYNNSLNPIVSLGLISCFHFVIRIIYMWEVIIAITTMSGWGLSINSNHKWYEN